MDLRVYTGYIHTDFNHKQMLLKHDPFFVSFVYDWFTKSWSNRRPGNSLTADQFVEQLLYFCSSPLLSRILLHRYRTLVHDISFVSCDDGWYLLIMEYKQRKARLNVIVTDNNLQGVIWV